MLKPDMMVLAEIDRLVDTLGALPSAPLSMPKQMLETESRLRSRPALGRALDTGAPRSES
ncbi:hypothetical protein CCR83_06805 [Rhodobacter veldkampii DSM 11550]|uniref:Uncharacterized protein n=1 Tax=Phaeovulum veldkampii DSM 11550 TaxID=1185920 RepID=A0A2T4JD51_9RHOB|nr:hypothetical protein [Phaeovulum veldkampii]MBK5946167.1 hypothetical protein [Phaeovulum veldkampii DSM 11550]PTE15835.1 hypothetical protein C5F46_13565 [Phaeovulum veldkampii DSM 11550]TDQ56558.1 hypothetical protein EV658_11724 [Phaeovulum veldkampii DSM 11550]